MKYYNTTERHTGVVVRELTCAAEGPRIKITFDEVIEKILCSPSSKWVLDSLQSRACYGRGDLAHPLHAVSFVTSLALTLTAPTANQQWNSP